MKSPGIAVLISLFVPGGGSIYCEKIWKGIGFLVATVIGYSLFIIPGIVLHICSIAVAYEDAKASSSVEGEVRIDAQQGEQSSTGLDENVAGFFCYLLGFVTGILFLVLEKKSRFVKFHAKQSTITFLGVFFLLIVFGWIPVIGSVIWILGVILWLFLMIKAIRGERYSLPIVGKMAEEKANQ